jgi:hypothetical protein
MADTSHAFGIYGEVRQAETAVDELLDAGFEGAAITVLHPDNEDSRDFAARKGTRVPRGTGEGATADRPLDGSWGLLDPAEGPLAGALPGSLEEMGIVPEWFEGTAHDGKVVLSVECPDAERAAEASEILTRTNAQEAGVSGPDGQPAQLAVR